MATLNSKGQITVPRDVRERMGLKAGDIVEFVEIESGTFAIKSVMSDVRALKGLLKRPNEPVSVKDMNTALRARAARSHDQ